MRLLVLALTLTLFYLSYADSFNCNSSAIGDDLRKVFLDFHNDGRRRIANGQQKNIGKYLNKAANMNKLRWNCDMEKTAQDYIKSCNAPGGRLGPYIAVVSNFNGYAPLKEVVQFSLKMAWSSVDRNNIPDTNEHTVCALDNFAHMANSRATQLACTVNRCGSKMQLVCLYNAIGTIRGQPMWETGEPCSECIGKSSCENGLCVRPEEKPDDGTSTICSTEGMTDKIRNRILDTHNEFRSYIARGLARNGTKGYAPEASVMYKLRYDCELEKLAMEHAKKCTNDHRPASERGGNGENIYTIFISGLDKAMIGEDATAEWFYELKRYGVFPDNRFTDALNTRPKTVVGHYTQLAWATTKFVGCAVQDCGGKKMVVVCNYSPAGNVKDHVIYEMGKPCLNCPSGTSCFPDEGLCVFPDNSIFSWLRSLQI